MTPIQDVVTYIDGQLDRADKQHNHLNDPFVLGYMEALLVVLQMIDREFHVKSKRLQKS